jgi:hypothetical protein
MGRDPVLVPELARATVRAGLRVGGPGFGARPPLVIHGHQRLAHGVEGGGVAAESPQADGRGREQVDARHSAGVLAVEGQEQGEAAAGPQLAEGESALLRGNGPGPMACRLLEVRDERLRAGCHPSASRPLPSQLRAAPGRGAAPARRRMKNKRKRLRRRRRRSTSGSPAHQRRKVSKPHSVAS